MSLAPNIVPDAALNDREVQVLEGISRGLTAYQIGSRLGLTENTVRTYSLRVRVKLRALSSAHAVRLGFDLGYLTVREREAPC